MKKIQSGELSDTLKNEELQKMIAGLSFGLWKVMRNVPTVGDSLSILISVLSTMTINVSDEDWLTIYTATQTLTHATDCGCAPGIHEAEKKLFQALNTFRNFAKSQVAKADAETEGMPSITHTGGPLSC